jgi:hypothetical protein
MEVNFKKGRQHHALQVHHSGLLEDRNGGLNKVCWVRHGKSANPPMDVLRELSEPAGSPSPTPPVYKSCKDHLAG